MKKFDDFDLDVNDSNGSYDPQPMAATAGAICTGISGYLTGKVSDKICPSFNNPNCTEGCYSAGGGCSETCWSHDGGYTTQGPC